MPLNRGEIHWNPSIKRVIDLNKMESFTGITLFNFLPHVGRSSMYPTGYEVLCTSRLRAWSLQKASAHALNISQDGKSYEEGASVAAVKFSLDAKATVPLTLVGIMKTQPEPRPHMERLEQV